MNIHLDPFVSRTAAPRVQHAVFQALRGRRVPELQVYVSRPRPGRWSVFLSGLPEHPLALSERIAAALDRGDRWVALRSSGPTERTIVRASGRQQPFPGR
jgi:hypothetical protein